MNDDYLWDRSGEPDPEVVRLEQLLGRYRYAGGVQAAGLPPGRRRNARTTWKALAIAAALILVIAASALVIRFQWANNKPWEIETIVGTPTVDGVPIKPHDRLGVGDTLVTDAGSHAKVHVARLGELEILPNSSVELVATRRNRHRIALHRGQVNARVWAPPFVFGVDTPAGLASDIGCAFTLKYAGDEGLLRVTSGWVDFDGDARSSLVPQGAESELDRAHGPGTPYWHDAPPALRAALRDFDRTGSEESLRRVLAAARPRDAMTLEHLLERARREHRGLLFDRLAQLAPPPRGVTREGVVEGNDSMVYAWRKALGLGGVKKWWWKWRDAL